MSEYNTSNYDISNYNLSEYISTTSVNNDNDNNHKKRMSSVSNTNKNKRRKHYKYEPLHKLANDDNEDYTTSRRKQIQTVYIVFAIIWLVISYIFSFYCGNLIIYIFVIVPIIVFGLNFYWVPKQTLSVTSLMFSADFLSIGFLIVTVIINWYREVDKKVVFGLVVLILIILGFSTIDIWTSEKDFIIIQHIRSALETIAVSVLMITVYKYYLEVQKTVYEKPDIFTEGFKHNGLLF